MTDNPSTEDPAATHRWHAIECNNLAWRLSEQTARSPAEDEEMFHAAHAAAFHWSRAGNELNRARAAMLLGRVHALLGHGDVALDYALQSHDYIEKHDPPDWEIAFSHAVLAHAAFIAGNLRLFGTHYARARELGAAIADDEDRATFLRTFEAMPRP